MSLLIVYNIFGDNENYEFYKKDIDSIFWHINNYQNKSNIKLVISAVLKSDYIIEKIKEEYSNQLTIFRYDDLYSVQVTANKTILESIDYFQIDFLGYLYISAGVTLNKNKDFFPKIIKYLNEDFFGVIHIEVDEDNGPNHLVFDEPNNEFSTLKHGEFLSLNIAVFHKVLKDNYGVPLSDIFGRESCENTFFYLCKGVNRDYVIMNNSMCTHKRNMDSVVPNRNSKGQILKYYHTKDENGKIYPLLWGKTYEKICEDDDAMKIGLSKLFGCDKYDFDIELFINNKNLIDSIKRCLFTNKNELDYNLIQFEII